MRLPFLLLWLILFAWATPAAAQNPIHRCIGANGNPVFTDQPCDSMRATSVTAAAKVADTPQPLGPPPILCAGSLADLRQSVIDAFANHDANRLAGLMLWGGYGRGAAVADIQSLTALMRHPLLDLGPTSEPAIAGSDGDPYASDTPPDPAPSTGQLVLHVADNSADGSSHALRFDIVHRSGCLWLRSAG
jgi:Domain of unknown function (DUF4124)